MLLNIQQISIFFCHLDIKQQVNVAYVWQSSPQTNQKKFEINKFSFQVH